MPDLFNGDPIPLNRPDDFDFPKWMSQFPKEEQDKIIDKSIKTMKEKYGVKVSHIASRFDKALTSTENWCCRILLGCQICCAVPRIRKS